LHFCIYQVETGYFEYSKKDNALVVFVNVNPKEYKYNDNQ